MVSYTPTGIPNLLLYKRSLSKCFSLFVIMEDPSQTVLRILSIDEGSHEWLFFITRYDIQR
jgi:hypothetical protein